MKPQISVEQIGESKYRVTVQERGNKTTHDVVAEARMVSRYAPDAAPEQLLKASFAFLLEREPKESILREFQLSDIERYFPDYPKKIRDLL